MWPMSHRLDPPVLDYQTISYTVLLFAKHVNKILVDLLLVCHSSRGQQYGYPYILPRFRTILHGSVMVCAEGCCNEQSHG